VKQVHERLEGFAIPHGVIAAALGGLSDRQQLVQVASVDTLYRRAIVDGRLPLPDAELVIFDEAHLALGRSRVAILDRYPNALRVGFSATPAKLSGRPLGEQFEELIVGPSVQTLIDAGLLVRPRVFNRPVMAAEELDAVARDSKSNDYAVGELAALMSRNRLVGDVVQNWLRIANGKRTLVFACNKAHGAHLVEQFRREGVAAELLTDQDDEPSREAAVSRLAAGQSTVIVNCFLLSYGVDIPSVECIVLARPTRSVVLYLQAIGRGMRPAPGKDFVIVIDHGRVVERIGLPTQSFDWSLRADSNVNRQTLRIRDHLSQMPEKPRSCPECGFTWLVSEQGGHCTECGWAPSPKPLAVSVRDAELHEHAGVAESFASADVISFFRQAIGWYARRWPDRWQARQNSGRWWAWTQTRERFSIAHERPPKAFWNVPVLTPTDEVSGYIKSRQIAWAKRRAA
jgi:superfamily II DNA or RNA helicase